MRGWLLAGAATIGLAIVAVGIAVTRAVGNASAQVQERRRADAMWWDPR